MSYPSVCLRILCPSLNMTKIFLSNLVQRHILALCRTVSSWSRWKHFYTNKYVILIVCKFAKEFAMLRRLAYTTWTFNLKINKSVWPTPYYRAWKFNSFTFLSFLAWQWWVQKIHLRPNVIFLLVQSEPIRPYSFCTFQIMSCAFQ